MVGVAVAVKVLVGVKVAEAVKVIVGVAVAVAVSVAVAVGRAVGALIVINAACVTAKAVWDAIKPCSWLSVGNGDGV